MTKCLTALIGVFISWSAWAQMPHEVLLLVNKQSQASMKVANTFAAMRKIPASNIVYLDVPESAYGGTATVSPDDFTQLIWEPAHAVARERGIDGHILAWVYSVDFPIRIATDTNDRRQMSICGLTFLRNKVPGLSLVEDGKYLSKLFMGPNDRLKRSLSSLSLRTFKVGLGDQASVPDEVAYLKDGLDGEMPLPNMMLGYIGENGNDVDTVLSTIQRGVKSDYRGKREGIYFVMSDDVRSKCREWQFYPAVNELQERGITAVVTTNFPAGKESVFGVLAGAETVDPASIESFAPGAMAEHLTSWSAEFQKRQTKMTEWLKAGATASAGAVVEPYSNANKFPSARFYVHYASGCTMMESFYQSIACPLQILLLGEPFARPYAPGVSVRLLGLETIKDDFTYMASANSRLKDAQYLYTFLLDGRPYRRVSGESSVWLSVSELSDGYHELRVVAWPRYQVEFGATMDKPIIVNKTGRSIEIDGSSIVKTGKYKHSLKAKLGGLQVPVRLRLVCGERVLDEQDYAEDVQLTLDEKLIGEGPTRIQVVAIYADGMEVASRPLNINITFVP